jgi:drug/metabolite transporter (DMT)-like permease
MTKPSEPGQLLPSALLVIAAAGWGLFWIPLREFEAAGLSAGWASAVQFVMPVVVLLPVSLVFALQGKPVGLARWQTAIFTGGAWALYADSLLLTDVARALILFYATPVWSTMLEMWLMGRRLTAARIAAIVLGLGGLYVILGGDGSLPIPRNAGDWMALLSGMFWAYGSTRIRMAPEASLFENAFSFFASGAVVTVGLAFLPIEAMGTPPTVSEFVRFLPWIMLMTLGFLIPAMLMQLYGTKLVDPARVGILFQTEAIVGIGSAAILTAEPFGWQEAIGSVLVVSAALTEVFGNRSRPG